MLPYKRSSTYIEAKFSELSFADEQTSEISS